DLGLCVVDIFGVRIVVDDGLHRLDLLGRGALVLRHVDDALASGNRYMSQYPKSQDAAYVQYLIGLTYSKQIVDVTQDPRASAKTIEAMQAVIDT
ncbi:outer membrane protein assembly factor BamD, partial [Rhizobium leguminosarum]|uniref:outer membrane protein assembly factor BamD n=1 Tax=Rhizobium leguminosarum TaxID=384 RepID=UPI003F9CED11